MIQKHMLAFSVIQWLTKIKSWNVDGALSQEYRSALLPCEKKKKNILYYEKSILLLQERHIIMNKASLLWYYEINMFLYCFYNLAYMVTNW